MERVGLLFIPSSGDNAHDLSSAVLCPNFKVINTALYYKSSLCKNASFRIKLLRSKSNKKKTS